MSTNSYYTYLEGGPRPWDPYDPTDLPVVGSAYLAGVFREFERHWRGRPLTVYLTYDTSALPSYGPDVVAVLLNDEWFRTPSYCDRVLAVLRNLPDTPWFAWNTLFPPDAPSMFALANYVRILLERRGTRGIGHDLDAAGDLLSGSARSIDIPLGYSHQPDLPLKPFEQRQTDVFFAGSLVHDLDRKGSWKQALKRLVGSPKTVHRKAMIREVERFRARHGELRAKITVSGDFRSLGSSDVTSYAEDMMDARVALVPQGTAAESYRLFEAWRYGCIVICEQLPPRPFLQGAPAIVLRSWRELEAALSQLLGDPQRQLALHEASLAWWREVCSEDAVGRHLAGRLAEPGGSPGDGAAAGGSAERDGSRTLPVTVD
jgi:hypothetical protein